MVFKPNFAYFEALGASGMEVLQELIRKIPAEIPVLGDAKRGDVGHSAEMYAKAVFETFECDAVTVTPYQGEDAIRPFLAYRERGVFVLCLTSNPGAADFQLPEMHLQVAKKVKEWNVAGNAGLVVGATRPENIAAVRKNSGKMPFLIPGVGAQGGDLEKTLIAAEDGSKNTLPDQCFPQYSLCFLKRGFCATGGRCCQKAARSNQFVPLKFVSILVSSDKTLCSRTANSV